MILEFLSRIRSKIGGWTLCDALLPPVVDLDSDPFCLLLSDPNPSGLSRILYRVNEENWCIWQDEEELHFEEPIKTITVFAQAFESSGLSDSKAVTHSPGLRAAPSRETRPIPAAGCGAKLVLR